MKKNNEQPVSNEGNNNVNKNNKTGKHSSALAAAAKAGSATENVKPSSTRDINGSSGTRNTGTNVDYSDKE